MAYGKLYVQAHFVKECLGVMANIAKKAKSRSGNHAVISIIGCYVGIILTIGAKVVVRFRLGSVVRVSFDVQSMG